MTPRKPTVQGCIVYIEPPGYTGSVKCIKSGCLLMIRASIASESLCTPSSHIQVNIKKKKNHGFQTKNL